MAILKRIQFGSDIHQIAQTKVSVKDGLKALTVTSTNTDLAEAADPNYEIALAVDGKTILDEATGLKSGLSLKYVAATIGDNTVDAHIALVDNDNTELSTVSVSEIIGSGIVESSSYSETTGVLSIKFVGSTDATEINLGKLLDIDDVAIAEDSKDYLGVTLDASASETGGSQAKFSAKVAKMAEVSEEVTGLADALDVKTYVDEKVNDKNVSASGDNYVEASANGNKVTVTTNVKELTATDGTVPVYDTEGTATTAKVEPTLTGVANALADASDIASKVKTYVDGKVAIEDAVLREAIKAAIRELDATVYSAGTTDETFNAATDKVKVKVVETDGKLTSVQVATQDIASDQDLTAEVARAKSAETAIDAVVGLTKGADGETRTYTNSGNYIGKETSNTVLSDIKALDTQLKTITDTAAAIKYNVDGTTLVFGGITKDATLMDPANE